MDWIRGETIGHGSFASVSLAKYAKPTSQNSQLPPLMAVKSCSVSCSVSLQKEKLILDELRDCPQIINCFGDDYSFEHGQKLYNVMLEYAAGGNLADKIKKSSLPVSEVRKYTNSILKGLDFIHRIGYVHCDIKLQNLLLFNDGIKIADFGLSKQVNQENQANNQENRYELRGTPLYMSPEVVSAGDLTPAADIWALGCVVSEMISGIPVWNCRRESDVGALLMRIAAGNETPEIPAKISEEGKDFLTKCFVKDPNHRWTAEMLLNHPFITDHQILTVDKKHLITPSSSPTSAFNFPNWPSIQYSITSLPFTEYSYFPSSSPSERLRKLVNDGRPDWSVTDEWVTLR